MKIDRGGNTLDKKKLIGTIVGVVAFVALVASATYAWLTATANITNGTLNTGSRNFVINYSKGTDLSNLPMLTVTSGSAVASSGASSLTVKAGLASSNNPPGNLSLTLVTTSDVPGVVTAGALKYAVKVGSGTITEPQTVTSNNQVLVLSGTNTTTQRISSTTQTNIVVYVWLDSELVTGSMVGKAYSGYIKATASQLES